MPSAWKIERDLAREAHVQAIGFWSEIYGVFCVGLAVLCIQGRKVHPEAAAVCLVVGLFFIAAGLAARAYWAGGRAMLTLGYFLLVPVALFTGANLEILKGLGLDILPVSHDLGELVSLGAGALCACYFLALLWALWTGSGRRMFQPAYAQAARAHTGQSPRVSQSPFFLANVVMIGMVLVSLGMYVASRGVR